MEKEKVQAHKLTGKELQELQYQQGQGESVATVAAKGGEDASYRVPKHEQHLVHVRIVGGGFNPNTGAPLGVPQVQKFYPQEYKNMVKTQAFAGSSVTVLHDGTEEKEALNVALTDSLIPQIVSQPGAGTYLTVSADEILKMNAAQKKEVYKNFFPEVAEKDIPKGAELQAAIEERRAFLATEEEARRNAQTAENALNADVNAGAAANAGTV